MANQTMINNEIGANRWGVQLKKTTQRCGSPSKEVDPAQHVKNRRASLRHVNLPPRQRRRSKSRSRSRSRSSSLKRRSAATGSSCSSLGWRTQKANGSAFLGVQLKPFPLKTIREDEVTDFFDLKLLGESEDASSSQLGSGDSRHCNNQHCSSCGEIAVRRKPKTRRNSRRRGSGGAGNQNKVYQIDLDPVDSLRGRGGKSLLEVKARSVKKEVPEDNPELDRVELELRHVVDPKDGSPRQIMTEAIFQVPLSKAVQPLHWDESDQDTPPEPQELLQISIQNLRPDSVQLVLKQVDPDTRDILDMQNVIDIHLTKEEGMKVQLQRIPTTTDRWGNSACKDNNPCSGPCRRSSIDLKEVRCDLGNDEEYEEDPESNDAHDSEDFNSSIHITLKDCMNKLEMSSLTFMEDGDWWAEQQQYANKPPLTSRSASSIGKIDVGLNVPRRTQDEVESASICKMHPSSSCKAKVCDQCPSMPKRSSHTAATLDESSSTRGRMPFPMTELKDDDSDDDSSMSSSSRYEDEGSESDEDELELVEIVPPPPPPPPPSSPDSAKTIKRDLFTLYGRMGCPTKMEMKERVLKMDGAEGIDPEDVELLPWLAGGRFLNYRAMNHMLLSDDE